jgi:hypothetical protein
MAKTNMNAPKPTLNGRNIASPTQIVGASPHASEARMNVISPPSNKRWRPWRSPSRPPSTSTPKGCRRPALASARGEPRRAAIECGARVAALIGSPVRVVESVAKSFPARKPFGIAASGRT